MGGKLKLLATFVLSKHLLTENLFDSSWVTVPVKSQILHRKSDQILLPLIRLTFWNASLLLLTLSDYSSMTLPHKHTCISMLSNFLSNDIIVKILLCSICFNFKVTPRDAYLEKFNFLLLQFFQAVNGIVAIFSYMVTFLLTFDNSRWIVIIIVVIYWSLSLSPKQFYSISIIGTIYLYLLMPTNNNKIFCLFLVEPFLCKNKTSKWFKQRAVQDIHQYCYWQCHSLW